MKNKTQEEKLKEDKLLTKAERKDYISQLFGNNGVPFLFKILIDDAFKFGEKAGKSSAISDVIKIVKDMKYGTKNTFPVCHGCCEGILQEIKKLKEKQK